METRKHNVIAAGIAALMIAGTLPTAALAQSSRQKDKNNMRNLGIGLGAAGLWELLHGKGTTGILLGAGAAYAGKKYEDARKAQRRENNDYHSRNYRYNHSHLSYGGGSNSSMGAVNSAASGQYGQPVNVLVNNEKVDFSGKQGAEVIDGSTYVPLRGVLDKMGANVNWDQSSKTVTIVKGDKTVKLPANALATVNGKQMKLDTPAFMMDGQTMLPLRFLAQTFGANVNWDANDNTVRINSSAAA